MMVPFGTSYATGTVAAARGSGVGGLVGTNSGSATVSASYATGRVEGRTDVGGLVGKNSATITASYAIGRVSGQADIGGLVGQDDSGTISDSYWNTATAGVKVSVGSDDEDGNGEINGTEAETTGASGKTTSELQTPTGYTDIYANWDLNVDNTGGADDPWYFGTASDYPVLKLNIDLNGDDTVNDEDWKTQQPPSPPSPPPAPKPSTSSPSSSDDDDDSEEPDETDPPAQQPQLIGQSSSTSAYELDDSRVLLRIHNPDDPENPIGIEVGIGSINAAGTEIVPVGYVRDDSLGQTYAVLRREFDGKIVRRWIAPDSPLALIVPWDIVNSQYTFPVAVIVTIPLDERWPHPNQLARRFDGGDDRILSYDANLLQWRHVPDLATFQSLGFYWCDVTAADTAFFERINLGTPYPAHQCAGPVGLSQLPAVAQWPVVLALSPALSQGARERAPVAAGVRGKTYATGRWTRFRVLPTWSTASTSILYSPADALPPQTTEASYRCSPLRARSARKSGISRLRTFCAWAWGPEVATLYVGISLRQSTVSPHAAKPLM